MFKLEHEANDKSKVAKLMPTLRELEETKSEWKDDYKLNSMMRNVLRVIRINFFFYVGFIHI
jgi:hypothetical protein